MKTKTWLWIFLAMLLIVPAMAIDSNSTNTSEWKMMGRTLTNYNFITGIGYNFTQTLNFSFSSNTPLYYNGKIYVASADNVSAYYLNGTFVWNHTYSGFSAPNGMAIAGDYLVYGEFAGLSRSRLVALNISNNGSVIWNVSLATPGASPLIYNDRVYAKTRNGVIKSFLLNNGSVNWSVSDGTSSESEWDGTFAYYNSTLFSTGYNGVWAWNADNGSTIWHFVTPTIWTVTVPVYWNNSVYVLSNNYIYKINASNGVQLWNSSCGSVTGESGVTVDDDRVYAKTNYICAVYHNGTSAWNYIAIYSSRSRPFVSDNYLYVKRQYSGDSSELLTVINKTNGDFLYNYTLDSTYTTSNSEILSFDNKLLTIGSSNIHLFSLAGVSQFLSISLNLPSNNSELNNTGNVNLNFTVTGTNSTYSCDLYVNNSLNQTNASTQNNTLTNFNVPVVLGSYNWKVNCTDGTISNISETRYFSVWNLSLSNPIVNPNATYAGQNVSLNVTVTGNVSSVWASIWRGVTNVATVVLNFISGNLWSGTVTTNDTYVGINNVTFYANDSLNRNRSVDIQNGLNVSSNDAPAITLLYPSSSAQVGDVDNVTFNFSATDDHLTSFKCDLYINSVLNKTNASVQNNTVTSMVVNVTLGTYTWQIRCNDTYKEGTSSTRTFYVNDTTAPSMVVQSPTAINYTVTTIGLNYTVSDRHLDKCWYVNVTGQIVQLPSCVNTTFTALQGNNNITVYANDTSNNINSTQIFFFVDSIAPVISNVATVNGTTSIQIYWDTNENANGTVKWGNTTALLNTTIDTDPFELNHYVILSPVNESTLYYFNLTSCDPYGNCVTAGIYNATTTTGNLPPIITILSPLNNDRVNIRGYALTVTFNVFDDHDSISNCSLIVDGLINQTNTSISVGGTYGFNVIMSGGRHSLKINCTDTLGLTGDPPINITVPYEKIKNLIIDMNGLNYTNLYINMTALAYNSSNPSNISIDFGADLSQEWNYSGTLVGSTFASLSSSLVVSWKNSNCTPLAGFVNHDYCAIPILFKSDTQGFLATPIINLTYDENITNYPGGITIDNITNWYNDSWLNGSMITAILNVTPINNWLSSGNCSVAGGNLSTDVSSFLSGILYLSDLKFTYGSNITPIVITNATVNPPAVFPNQNFTINATVNISGAIYSVDIIQNTLYDGGFGNVNNNVSENFTVVRKSAIGRIDVYNVGTTTGNLTLKVYNYPSWTLLQSKTISNYSSGWIMFDFTQQSRIRLNNGSSYIFEITSDASNWNNLGYSNNDTYLNGMMFIDRNPEIGKDLMFRILMYDYDVGSVWAQIWSGVTIWWTGFLDWVTGDLWSVVVNANQTWGNFVNITIYANTTTGQNATPWQTNLTIYNVTYPIISANITPESPQNYSPTRVYEIRINCYTPYNISNVTVTHDFTGTNITYVANYDAGNSSWLYTYQRINVGNYSWSAKCVDGNGLYNETSVYGYEVVKAYPALRVSILPSAVSSYTDMMNVSCISDNTETIANMRIDGTSAANPTFAVFPIATYFVECNQTGNSNWYSAYANASMTIIDMPPIINLTSPADAYVFPATTTQVSLEFNVSDPDSSPLTVNVIVNGTIVSTISTNNTENSVVFNVTSNTTYNWYAVVSDGHTAINSENRTFSISAQSYNQLPTINLIYPANNTDLANTFTFVNFTWEINDTDSSSLGYTLFVDSFSRCSDSVAPNAIFSCLVGPFMPNSTHYWNVSVYDDPNTVWSYTYRFTINATCTPNWVPNYTSCLPTNFNVKSYFDSNACGNFTTMPVDNGTSTTCDYCTPNFYCSAYHACTREGRQDCAVVSDNLGCFAQTGLPSDAYAGDMSEFERGCTYQSVLVVIPQEAGAALAMFMWYITTPVGILLLWLVLLAVMLAIGLIIAAYIRGRAGGG